MDVRASVAAALGDVPLLTKDVDRAAYTRDLYPRHHLDVRRGSALLERMPAAIIQPRSTEDVARIVRHCVREGISYVPYGAGSGVCDGVAPNEKTLVIDVKRLGRVRRLDGDGSSIDVEAGALGITLEEDIQRAGFTIGHFPSSILCSTAGGWVAARGAGQCSGRYGKIEDMVLALELVDGDGEVRVLKRRAHGPDLTPLVIGSEGTTGVLTSVTLRTHPVAKNRAYAAYGAATTEAGWELLRALFQAGLRPAVARLYDPFDSFLANRGKVKNEDAKPGGGARQVGLLLRKPKLLNELVDGPLGALLGDAMIVLIFEGHGDEPAADAAIAAQIAAQSGAKSLGEGPARGWLSHRYSVSYRQAPVFRMGAFSDTMEVAATWSKLGGLYDGVRKALGDRVFVMAHLSHAYPDGCSIYFTFAGSGRDDDDAKLVYDRAWRSALDAAIAAGGTLSHHHGVGRSKAPRLGAELGIGVEVARAVLRGFDPHALSNPGNLLPAHGERVDVPRALGIDAASRLVTASAKTTVGELRALLAGSGLSSPIDGAIAAEMPIGTWFEDGAEGVRDVFDDPVDHLVAGLRAELPSGQELVIRPGPRRAVGPDLVALFHGMRGRAGRVTELTLRAFGPNDRARPLPFHGDREPALSEGERTLAARICAEVAKVR